MEICEKCGVEFEEWEAEDAFHDSTDPSVGVWYSQFERHLCGGCAIEEYNNGNYFEECECCGKRFHPEDEVMSFMEQMESKFVDGYGENMYEYGICCADCAVEKFLEKL